MRLESFAVQGFKNIVERVRLDRLGPINVLHGDNNVGKSNLLQAIALFFTLVGLKDNLERPLVPQKKSIDISDAELAKRGFPRVEIFNLEAPTPIRIEASVSLAQEDFDRAGRSVNTLALDRVHVGLELRWMGTHTEFSILRFETADGRDLIKETMSDPEHRDLVLAAALISKNLRIAAEPVDAFARIGVERLERRDLALTLYDAANSPDLDASRHWGRFVESMEGFSDIVGKGSFIATYDRKTSQANLLFQTDKARIPLALLGSGVQQLVALFGQILTSGAAVVAVEEPELNLRWALQERVRDALQQLVGKEGAPGQLFLTSHSGAFEVGDSFYLMQRGDAGPTIERRPIADAVTLVGQVADAPPSAAPKTPTHVSSDGVLRLPKRVLAVVGIEQGGAVSFIEKEEGIVEMMSDDTFLRRAGVDG